MSHPSRARLDDREIEGLHEVELGIERVYRAHGHLVAFHHNIGRGMEDFVVAEPRTGEGSHGPFAETIRHDILPRGVFPGADVDDPLDGRRSYDLPESFQSMLLDDIITFADDVHEALVDGDRHLHERRQERDWKRRAFRT